jgi:hypothetical protein
VINSLGRAARMAGAEDIVISCWEAAMQLPIDRAASVYESRSGQRHPADNCLSGTSATAERRAGTSSVEGQIQFSSSFRGDG